jgi:TonB family protein
MSSALTDAALAIAAAVFNSLWEGVLIAGAVWFGLRCLPKLGASSRYAIWLCALAALVVIPLSTAGLSAQQSAPAVAMTAAGERVAAPDSLVRPTSNAIPAKVERVTAAPASTVPAAPLQKSQITITQSLALAIGLIWVLVAGARGLRLLLNVRELNAIRGSARLWSAAHDYPVLLSNHVHVPIAIGFFHPAIILPASLVEQLDAGAVDTIIIHEVAHLRRYDVWTNAVARIVDAITAVNPAAWFIMRRLVTEREIACDDWVVARMGAGDAFAQTLLAMASSARGRAPIAAPSAIGSRHSIVVRIERLLDSRPRHLRLSSSALGGALMLLALFAFIFQSVSPVLAYASQPLTIVQEAASNTNDKCATPNRDILMTYYLGAKGHAGRKRQNIILNAPAVIAKYGVENVATFDLTVGADGQPLKVAHLVAPPYPVVAKHVTRVLLQSTYEPALHNCIPVTATIKGAFPVLSPPRPAVGAIVAPAYPASWSARYASACKVPTLDHARFNPSSGFRGSAAENELLPLFPDSMKNLAIGSKFDATVRVRVNQAGAATSAELTKSSGHEVVDNAALAAARRATYPLTEAEGFKPVRPSHAPLSWNATHGSDTYVSCKPLPSEYVWYVTFDRGSYPY